MDDPRDCLAHYYPFVVVRIACRVCPGRENYRLARLAAKLARRSPCEISPTASPTIAYGALRRGPRAGNRAAASTCPTSSKGGRLTCRQASRRSGWSRGKVRTKQKGGIRWGEGLRKLWRDWNQSSDLGLRMTKLGLLLLMATLIVNRILPKIEVESSDTLAVGLLVGLDIVSWLVWIFGMGLTLVGVARILTIDAH